MVKNVVRFLTLALIILASWKCSKNDNSSCTPLAPSVEDPAMLAYIADHNITAVKDPSGLYYQIISTGSGGSPTLNSKVAVKYSGYFMDGTKFDEMTAPVADPLKWWSLSGLITGWQIGLSKISKGGKIKLVVPSSLGYGCAALNGIPANSVLVFDVELVDFY